jgi:taurine transport system substrate-binding protein
MQPSEIYSAWTSGQIDATYVWEPTLSKLKNHKTLVTSAKMADDGYMTANVELVTESFAKANPKIVRAYIRALNKAVTLYNSNQSKAVSAVAKSLEISTSSAKFQMAGSKWLTAKQQIGSAYMGTSSKKGKVASNLYDIAQFLKDQKSITSVPSKSTFTSAIHPEYAKAVAG